MAGLLADPTRARFCLAMLDGRAWTAGELARHAGVAASTATEHLNALVGRGLLVQERQGRHRYVRLAAPDVAELIEGLVALDARPVEPERSLKATSRRRRLAHARTCYDHLAGTVGVAITDAMSDRGLLDSGRGLALTPRGAAWVGELGLAVAPGSRRPVVRACLDWTERRPHLAGAVGAALCGHAFSAGWIARVGETRAVTVTPAGVEAFEDLLAIPPGTLVGPRDGAS
ncbi:ArsR family transcriptional regulator [Actinorugispora endophytica]|uniref:ArsR family transcriptional regulator n=2 Tax=Actinorugispora endophytica TaxID=1605990 RepID=A0A4R6UNM7_9ACTN|nr:ArsR family transcriptional regulator [Actinorugispora endophytica]